MSCYKVRGELRHILLCHAPRLRSQLRLRLTLQLHLNSKPCYLYYFLHLWFPYVTHSLMTVLITTGAGVDHIQRES
jgi:hypothetical protein